MSRENGADQSNHFAPTGGISGEHKPVRARLLGFHHRSHLTAHAGAVLIRAVTHAVGLGVSVASHLHLKRRARGLTEAESIPAMAKAVTLGATCLDDLAIARADRAQEKLRGFAVPAPQTAGSFLKRFTLGHVRQLE